MKNRTRLFHASLALCALLGVSSTPAHHSTAAEFDQSKPITFTGSVKKVMWMNPHIYTLIEVKQASGESFIYHVEGSAPNTLFRQGWRKDSLKVGEIVTVSGWRAKNSASQNVGQATITADGKRIYSGDGPQKP